jgi:hybrid cluster-associated redox disulfide protein
LKAIVTKDMTLGDVVTRWPSTIEVMSRHGLHCIGCHISAFESVERGSMVHGLDKEELETMMVELNEAAQKDEAEAKKK